MSYVAASGRFQYILGALYEVEGGLQRRFRRFQRVLRHSEKLQERSRGVSIHYNKASGNFTGVSRSIRGFSGFDMSFRGHLRTFQRGFQGISVRFRAFQAVTELFLGVAHTFSRTSKEF